MVKAFIYVVISKKYRKVYTSDIKKVVMLSKGKTRPIPYYYDD